MLLTFLIVTLKLLFALCVSILFVLCLYKIEKTSK